VHDEQLARPGPAYEGVVAIIRMALTGGWVVGPMLGAWLAAAFGLRAMVWATALCFLVQMLPLGTMGERAPPKSPVDRASAAKSPGLVEMLPLLAFTGCFVLVYAGESVKYGFLLIYMEEQLQLAPSVRGAVIGLQPLIELLIMPFSVVLGRWIGALRLMAVAAALGVGANLCFALWGSAAGMIAGQVLMGGVWGLSMVLGLIVAQRLLPNAVATASAIFMTSMALGGAVGGVAGSLGVAALGLPHVFFIPAACALVAVAGLAAMAGAYEPRAGAVSVD
jgi:MFS transporter, SET family, sugar efflux transporter